MKVCYVDESGNDTKDPCLVMVGIVVDAYRLNRTREEFGEIFNDIQQLFQDNLKEVKGAKVLYGRGRWRNVDLETRKRIVSSLCDWVVERKHHIVLAAIDRERFKQSDRSRFPEVDDDPWLACSLHIALQLQKKYQSEKKNKGRTFLFIDDDKQKADKLSELLFQPPEWTDSYYGRRRNQARLDQLIDSSFAVKSHHVGLVQVADIYAVILRRYAELHEYERSEEWQGEKSLIDEWVRTLASRMLPKATRWPERAKAPCSKWYNDIAPKSLRALGS
jgi:hypothetical protein